MGSEKSYWIQRTGARIWIDLAVLLCLGVMAYLLFRHATVLTPAEGAILIMAAGGFLRVGIHWWDWHQGQIKEESLTDWARRIRQGERVPVPVMEGLHERDRQLSMALNAVIGEVHEKRVELADLKRAVATEWRDLDALLAAVQQRHAAEVATRIRASARLAMLGKDLKNAMERNLRMDQVELNHRLRADQFRLQDQAFRATLEQVRAGVDQFEVLLEELRDTFPRLRREGEVLGLLADSGLRHGARLALSVKGLVAYTPRLVEEAQERSEWLRRMRQSTDGIRDRMEALARRIEGFREEAQSRIRTFGGAQGSVQGLDHVAQQTGLLAVNAAILAQQDGGNEGMSAIGGRLRFLADQTAEGASGIERTLAEYRSGLEHEIGGLWELQEGTQKLLADVQELLRTAGHLDHQGHDLERALENHLSLVDQVRQASERGELSLNEIGERSVALESALSRQAGVEVKVSAQRERLNRVGGHLSEIGGGLASIGQQNVDEIWTMLARYQEIRGTDAYAFVTSGDLPRLLDDAEGFDPMLGELTRARDQRRFRLLEAEPSLVPAGHQDADGGIKLLLLEEDALRSPAPSALESCVCDATGQSWNLNLLVSLRSESLRLALLELLKRSALVACFPGLEMRITPEGAQVRLPNSFPRLPGFLTGLGLELSVDPELWNHAFREARPPVQEIQWLIWMGPGEGGGRSSHGLRLAHSWLVNDPHHEYCLPWLPYEGSRPPCPWLGDGAVEERFAGALPVRCVALGADPSPLHPFRDRLVQAGAVEGSGGLALCAIQVGYPHPEALLLRLFQPDANLAGASHPSLVPYQLRLRDEVLGASTGDPYRAAWSLLEDLQRAGWLLPLPSL